MSCKQWLNSSFKFQLVQDQQRMTKLIDGSDQTQKEGENKMKSATL